MTLHIDGYSSIGDMGAGLILTPSDGRVPLRYTLVLSFKATNNEAEYEALIRGLRSKVIGATSLHAYCDSQLVVNQVKGEYAAN